MKTSQRILTDILREKNGNRLYTLDLLQDENGIFEAWKYYGDMDSVTLSRRKIISSEHYELVYSTYRKALDNKLKKKDFRLLADGEALISEALVKALKPGKASPSKSTKPAPKQEEHRKLRL